MDILGPEGAPLVANWEDKYGDQPGPPDHMGMPGWRGAEASEWRRERRGGGGACLPRRSSELEEGGNVTV